MNYKITLVESEEGCAVWCDDLPGCVSQGATREEAMQNIRAAIDEYLQSVGLVEERFKTRVYREEVTVGCRDFPASWQKQAERALAKAGFEIIRQGKHITMSDGVRIVQLPRHNPINSFTMGKIAKDAGFTPEEFKKLL